MFHQVFILDPAQEENVPGVSQHIDENKLFSEHNDSEDVIKNEQIKNEKEMDLDVPNNISEQPDKPQELVSEIIPGENKAQSELNFNLVLTQDRKVIKNEQIKNEKEMDVDVPNNISEQPDIPQELVSETVPGENKELSVLSFSWVPTQDNEALNRTCEIVPDKETVNLMKNPCKKQNCVNCYSKNSANNNKKEIKICEEFSMENTFLSGSNKGIETNHLLFDEKTEILSCKRNKSCAGFDTFKIENNKCEIDDAPQTKPNFSSNYKNLPDIQVSVDTCTQSHRDEDIDNSKKVTISSFSAPKYTDRTFLPSEEDSGSDWEQEYFDSTGIDLKNTASRDSSQQKMNTTSSEYSNEINHSIKSHIPIKNIYPVKLLKVVVHRLPVSNVIADSKLVIGLNERKESFKNTVFSKNSVHFEKISKNSEPSKVNEIALNRHKKLNNNKEIKITPHKCLDCGKFLSDKYCLKKHIKLKHPERALLIDQEKRVTEKKVQTNIKKENEEIFFCNVCNKIFETKTQLSNHTRTLCFGHRRPLKYQCDVCGKCFYRESTLQEHKNSHTNAKPFKCLECDKCFNYKTTRYMHYKRVHQNIEVRKYLCSFCGITSKNLPHMKAHEEIHRLPEGTEIPTPFQCNKCGRGYESRHKLNKHSKVHNLKKCPHCSEVFKTESLLVIHLKNVHNIVKLYKCKICEKTYENRLTLNSHKSSHSELKFFCDICDKGFKVKRHLVQHMITHSNERPLSCSVCGDRFKRKTHLNQHISAMHVEGKDD